MVRNAAGRPKANATTEPGEPGQGLAGPSRGGPLPRHVRAFLRLSRRDLPRRSAECGLERGVPVPMPDGVTLLADHYWPRSATRRRPCSSAAPTGAVSPTTGCTAASPRCADLHRRAAGRCPRGCPARQRPATGLRQHALLRRVRPAVRRRPGGPLLERLRRNSPARRGHTRRSRGGFAECDGRGRGLGGDHGADELDRPPLRGRAGAAQLSGGAHPRFARNTGTGEAIATGTEASLIAVDIEIATDPAGPGALFLPVMAR